MSDKVAKIKKDLELVRPDFDQLNLNNLSFVKEMEFAVQVFEKNTYLQGATPESINNSLKNIALTGLSLNPVLKYCYLIPRKEKGILQCCAEPSYMGLIKILTDTGSVLAISATIVYSEEIQSLVIQEGAGGHATHTHYFGEKKPGKPVACYSIAILPSGLKHVSLLREWQWDDVMKRSDSVKSYYAKKSRGEYAAEPTWLSDKEEMIRKTAIKNHYKYLPKTERAEMIGNVIEMDNQVNGINFENQNQHPKAKTVAIDLLDNSIEENVKKFSDLMELAKDGTIPNVFKTKTGEYNMANTIESMESDFAENTLHLEKFTKMDEFIRKTHAFFAKKKEDGSV